MCVNIINGETNNHTIQEKEQPKNKRIFAMDNSAVILKPLSSRSFILCLFLLMKGI